MIIFQILFCLNSSAQSPKLINDSTVSIGLKKYRAVRERLKLADSLITGYRYEIKKLEKVNEAIKEVREVTNMLLLSEQKRINNLEETNKELLRQLDKATRKKWYKRPELYLIAGVVFGVITTR